MQNAGVCGLQNVLFAPAKVRPAASIRRPSSNQRGDLHQDDSALCALTDFRREGPCTVEAECPMDLALADMVQIGVHALIVTQDDPDGRDHQVVGLITSYDIERVRKHRRKQAANPAGTDVRVGDVMTPWNELPLVRYESLQSLTASEMYERFQGTGLTHLLVVEMHDDECAFARGLLSRSALAKRWRRFEAIR